MWVTVDIPWEIIFTLESGPLIWNKIVNNATCAFAQWLGLKGENMQNKVLAYFKKQTQHSNRGVYLMKTDFQPEKCMRGRKMRKLQFEQ